MARIVWLEDAASALPNFPLVDAIVYFNSVNAVNNHMPNEPDWRIPVDVFAEFQNRVQNNAPPPAR